MKEEKKIKDESLTKYGEILPVKKELFDISAEEAKKKLKAIHEFQKVVKSQLKKNHDVGIIPGTDKPTLFKPGAEKIIKLLNCFDDYNILDAVRNWEKPFFHYEVKCVLYEMETNTAVSSGIGECNSYESKYRYRWIPEWNLTSEQKSVKDTMPFKEKGYRNKKGKFKLYRFENDDIFSLVNTLLKMAKKRAQVDAALSLGRLSDLFTQDLEDLPEEGVNNKAQHELNREYEPAMQEQIVDIQRMEATLVDNHKYDPYDLTKELQDRFGFTDIQKISRNIAAKMMEYLEGKLRKAEDKQ